MVTLTFSQHVMKDDCTGCKIVKRGFLTSIIFYSASHYKGSKTKVEFAIISAASLSFLIYDLGSDIRSKYVSTSGDEGQRENHPSNV